jgi:hypothetical protein
VAAFSVSYSYTQSVIVLGRGISPSQGSYLHTQNKCTQTSMPQVGFELRIPVFKQALDRVATVNAFELLTAALNKCQTNNCRKSSQVELSVHIFNLKCFAQIPTLLFLLRLLPPFCDFLFMSKRPPLSPPLSYPQSYASLRTSLN